MPRIRPNPAPKAKLRSLNTCKFTIGLRAVRTRAKNAAPVQNATTENTRMDPSSNQSFRDPSSSTYSSEPKNVAINERPRVSMPSSSDQFGSSTSTSAHTTTLMTIPIGKLMRKSQCQEKAEVRMPPSVGPTVGASVAINPTITLTPAARPCPNMM